MLPLLWKTKPFLPRKGIFLDEDDMKMFQLATDGTHAPEESSGGRIMKALSLGTLFFGMISLSDDELFFHLHPNKRAWHIKAQEMYGFEWTDMFTKIFALSCTMPSFTYWTYFREVRQEMKGGPAILPNFVREGLVNQEEDFIRLVYVFLEVQRQGSYPSMWATSLLPPSSPFIMLKDVI